MNAKSAQKVKENQPRHHRKSKSMQVKITFGSVRQDELKRDLEKLM